MGPITSLILNNPPNPPSPPITPGRFVFFAIGLIFWTKSSPASMSTPLSLYESWMLDKRVWDGYATWLPNLYGMSVIFIFWDHNTAVLRKFYLDEFRSFCLGMRNNMFLNLKPGILNSFSVNLVIAMKIP